MVKIKPERLIYTRKIAQMQVAPGFAVQAACACREYLCLYPQGHQAATRGGKEGRTGPGGRFKGFRKKR